MLLQTVYQVNFPFKTAGTLADWQKHVGAYCVGNDGLVFSVSMGFSAPLLKITREQSGGVHVRGNSTTGKPTSQRVAYSVWNSGEVIPTWRGTANGFEGIAGSHNDILLPLDEMGQALPREIGHSVYHAGQSSREDTRKPRGWRQAASRVAVSFPVSGEQGLADIMNKAGVALNAGQSVRLVEIPVGEDFIKALHGFATTEDFVTEIGGNSQCFYGTAGPAFIEALIASLEGCSQHDQRIPGKVDRRICSPKAPASKYSAWLTVSR